MEMPEEIRDKAMANAQRREDDGRGSLDATNPDKSSALCGSFIWAESEEGYEFWNEWRDKFLKDE